MTDDQQSDVGPDKLLELNDAMIQARALQIAAELGVADQLAGGPRHVDDLAKATSSDPTALHSLLRLLASSGVFTETGPRRFGLTPLGAHLRKDHPQSIRAIMVACERLLTRVFTDAMYTMRTGAAAFSHTYGEPLYGYLQSHPRHAALFHAMMADSGRIHSTAVANAYDFAGAEVIVDVGGGDGTLISAILQSCRQAAGVLLEAPQVAQAARERLADHGLTDRCTVVAGDFFQEVPHGGDFYLLKWIIHNWPDAQAVNILRSCRRAMSPDSRLLLIELLVPPGVTPHTSKSQDLAMLVLLQGQERTKDEYDALLAKAGFELARVVDTAAPVTIIEAVPIP
jgi:ubiquinone/menaquinone biosynthesis C-methylase UbiE